jgi:hypothetical protein
LPYLLFSLFNNNILIPITRSLAASFLYCDNCVYSSHGLGGFSTRSSSSILEFALNGGDVIFKRLNQFGRSFVWEGDGVGKVLALLGRRRESQLVVSVDELVVLEVLERVGEGGVVEERLNMPILTRLSIISRVTEK